MTKNDDAKKFQDILTAKNKETIEKSLDLVDPSYYCSASVVNDYLITTIGKRPTVFLKNLLDAHDFDIFISELKDISPENLSYIDWLYTKYSPKLKGVLSHEIMRRGDGWSTIFDVSSRYDIDFDELILKLNLIKNNKECVVIEDTYGSVFSLAFTILRIINENGEAVKRFKESVDVTKENIADAIKELNLLNERLFGGGEDKTREKEK
jgi:hypothetical protein